MTWHLKKKTTVIVSQSPYIKRNLDQKVKSNKKWNHGFWEDSNLKVALSSSHLHAMYFPRAKWCSDLEATWALLRPRWRNSYGASSPWPEGLIRERHRSLDGWIMGTREELGFQRPIDLQGNQWIEKSLPSVPAWLTVSFPCEVQWH